MPAQRRKTAIVSKRRVDEDEEDAGPDAEFADESMSEGSDISDDEDIAGNRHPDADGSKPSTQDKAFANGHSSSTDSGAQVIKALQTNGSTDTEIMMNGGANTGSNAEAIDYNDLREEKIPAAVEKPPVVVNSTAQMDQPQETPIERRRREHEDYKKKRDADPAFVPNRGNYFMHDHRHAGPAANGFRPFGRGRGRGRGGFAGPFGPHHTQQPNDPSDAPWTHDMHEAILEPDSRSPRPAANHNPAPYISHRPVAQAPRGPPPNRSLSTSKHVGNVQLRVILPGMKEPLSFPGVQLIQYTCLPDHRPPLRRDKPVRISLADHDPRYIYPATERSFIFIPRAMRPNQQGFGARINRGRQGFGSIGGYSRQTSVYGGSMYGSVYAPSVALSRRSSLAHEVPRDALLSPTGSVISRQLQGTQDRPIVRLPPSTQQIPLQQAYPAVNGQAEVSASDAAAAVHPYPPPQDPLNRENRPSSIPMHQPRPQKTVSVAGIESPATMSFNPPQQYQQPFHQQVPAEVNGIVYPHDNHLHPHSRNASFPSQGTGTPLSQIPERAVHAQAFQPNAYQQQNYYPQQYPAISQQPGYYYPQQYPHMMVPQAPSFVPAPAPSYSQQPSQDPAMAQAGGAGLVAQEANGMVYYYDASQLPVTTFPAFTPPTGYPMQQGGNMPVQYGMMTPSPDVFYPQGQQGMVFYGQ